MRLATALLALLLPALPAAAEMSAACTEDVGNVEKSFDETLKRLDSVAQSSPAEKCAAYRHHVEVMLAGREVFLRCLAGHDRSENVGQLEDSIGDFRIVIDGKCPQ